MDSPNFIIKHFERAKQLSVEDIVFSDGAYHAEIYDPIDKKTEYPFIQLDDQNNVQDAFCSCVESEECVHLAASYLAIFQNSNEPLEVKYQCSFWKHLLFMIAKRVGFDLESLKKENDDIYFHISKTGKKLFELRLAHKKAKDKFKEIIKSLKIGKDEVPLKFSKITEEELSDWKKNRASIFIHFELSFWADLAKWFTFLQTQDLFYEIIFHNDEIPKYVQIKWDKLLMLYVYISEANWPEIIPSLKTIKSNLQVFDELSEKIESIFYREIKGAFEIIEKTKGEPSHKVDGPLLGEWIYVKDKGFYPTVKDPMLEKKWIEKDEIAEALSNFTNTFEKYLKDLSIYRQPHMARHYLYFDSKDDLHVLIFPNNLDEALDPKSAFFCPWYYVPFKGFYRMKGHLFDQKEKIIPKKDVSSFVHSHRIWLHDFEGFQTHFGTMPSRFEYRLSKDDELEFFLKLELPQDVEKYTDFGDWLYIQNYGFYLKKDSGKPLPIRSGLILKKNEIGSFIKNHEEELEDVPNFFTKNTPIEKILLQVQVIDNKIHIIPTIVYKKGYGESNVKFFDQYTYVNGEGFSKLETQESISARYQTKTIIDEKQVKYFLNYELDRLKLFPIDLDKKLIRPKRLKLKVRKLKKEKRKGKVFWLVDLAYRSEIGEVEVLDLWEDLAENRKYSFSNSGLIHLTDPRFSWIAQLKKKKISSRQRLLRLSTLEWLRLCIFEEIIPPRAKTKEAEEIRRLLKDLSTLETSKLLDIHYLKSKLRPYQETGVAWLWFLYVHNLSGLLCDDMGLGKTHQAMALLAAVLNEDPDRFNKYLVICPTSVIYHWEELIKKYLPEMRVLTYYGVERSLDPFEDHYDLLLSSYGILRLGKENLKEYKFEVAIFDELQIAKNPASQTHKSIKQLRSNMRVGLSGTPIENRLKELKALFDIVLPAYFPSEKNFRELFINPIEKSQDPERKKLLSKLIRPFILRRKKKEVLLDLPEKIEEIAYCKLSDQQQILYKDALKERSNEIMDTLENEQEPIPYLHIFALLSKLKQICNHPSLIYKDVKSYKDHKSGKWDLFVELLHEAKESGQKLVVFSQYLDMLAIIERYLKQNGIVYASIKGATRKRQNEIRKFRDDPNCEVFVASLLAAGIGIDLTAGSVVIHYDRWWNPAKENQATDRVHRIGQNRGVQVFKLVTRDTIEEDIHNLIERKASLIEELVGKDDHEQLKVLSRDELIKIFGNKN